MVFRLAGRLVAAFRRGLERRIKTSYLPLLRRILTEDAFSQPVDLFSRFSFGAGFRESRSLILLSRSISLAPRFSAAAICLAVLALRGSSDERVYLGLLMRWAPVLRNFLGILGH